MSKGIRIEDVYMKGKRNASQLDNIATDVETNTSQLNNIANELDGNLDATNMTPELLNDIGNAVVANGTVTPEKTTFIEKDNSLNLFNPLDVEDGKFYDTDGSLISIAPYSSIKIDVSSLVDTNMTISIYKLINELPSYQNIRVVRFLSESEVVTTLINNINTITPYTALIPTDAKFILLSWYTYDVDSLYLANQGDETIDYIDYYSLDVFTSEITVIPNDGIITGDMLSSNIKTKLLQPVYVKDSIASNVPLVSFVDDDNGSNFITLAKPAFDALNVKCSLGIITDTIGTTNRLTLAQLQSLYAEGHDILSHSKTHSASIFYDGNFDLTLVDDNDILAEYETSFNYLKDNNMETETIVYPFGSWNDENTKKRYTNLAKQYYQFGVNSSVNGTFYDDVLDNMYNNRSFIQESVHNLTYYTDIIDEAILNNGWVIFGMHSYLEEFSTVFLQSILEYAINNGVTVKTFSEANEERRNICSVGTYGNKSETLYIGKNGEVKKFT